MLDLRKLSYFRSVTTGCLVVAFQVEAGFVDEDASGCLLPVPKAHSLWDAVGGTLAERYRFYQGVVVKPGDFIVVAYDKSVKTETIQPVYSAADMESWFTNVDVKEKTDV